MAHEKTQYNLPEEFRMANNICDYLNDEECTELGMRLLEEVQTDITSRKDWVEKNDKWMELVTQVMEQKTYPWPKASNIKYPLIATAAVQFHARAYPSLLGNTNPVKARVIGRDPKGLKAQRAQRVSTFMSYQVLEHMPDWVEDMDRLLFLVPIIGSMWKKTYYSEAKRRCVSELIHPRDFIINYDAIDHANARKSHRIWRLPNSIIEYQRRGLYREFDGDDKFEPPKQRSEAHDKAQGKNRPGKHDDYALQELFEVHCLLDLDDDGYKEPYIATIRASDGAMFRLVSNYDPEDMEYNDNAEIVAITEKDYFTHYMFLPDPESKTHGIGFGTIVGPLNEAVNTTINQLTDAGHMHTLGGGFLSRGIRMKGGEVRFKPNEWKTINVTGDDLRKGIFPLPTKEPSAVLFQMLGLLIDSGKDLSSVQDMMVGKNPGQNQPYATTQEVVKQGMKVFNGIYKRLYRSLSSEFKKLYKLNRQYPDVITYMHALDMAGQEVGEAMQVGSALGGNGVERVIQFLQADFNANDIDIIPTAEPDMVQEIQKIMRANALLEKMRLGMPLNRAEVTKRILEAEGHEDVPALMDVQPPQPDPEIVLKQEELQHKKQMDGLQMRLQGLRDAAAILKDNMEAELALAKANNESAEGLHKQFIEEKDQIRKDFDAITTRMKVISDARQNAQARKQDSGASGESK